MDMVVLKQQLPFFLALILAIAAFAIIVNAFNTIAAVHVHIVPAQIVLWISLSSYCTKKSS